MAVEKEKFIRNHVEGMNKYNEQLKNQNDNNNKRRK